MTERRVVITGIGLTSPIGNNLEEASAALRQGRHGIKVMPEWDSVKQLGTRLAGVVTVSLAGRPRQKTRAMGRVSLLAAYACDQAIAQAGLTAANWESGRAGLAYGSTHGSTTEMEVFCRSLFANEGLAGIPGSSYLKFMSHTCAANLAQYYGIRGRVIPTVAACASASQAIGAGYEAIRYGLQDLMMCGGAEEMHSIHAGAFDLVYAASTHYNDRPDLSPRPFDAQRDGLVVSEGAGTLILEEYEHAKARSAQILAEVTGYGTSCDGTHVTSPSSDGMAAAMQLCLETAKLRPSQVDYINAHATATEVGDIAESHAVYQVFKAEVPISSTKGFTGHTLGACGAIEAAFCIDMIREGYLAPSRNLEQVDPRCAPLAYLQGEARAATPQRMMSNNFAFGGINTSLLIQRFNG